MNKDFFQDDPEFFDEVDVFIASQPEDEARVRSIEARLPDSFHEVLRRRDTLPQVVRMVPRERWDRGAIAACASVAAALAVIGLLFVLDRPDEVAVSGRTASVSGGGEMEFVVTILEDGEPEIVAQRGGEDAGASRGGEVGAGDEPAEVEVAAVEFEAVGDRYLSRPQAVGPPQVPGDDWSRTAIDRFVLAALVEDRAEPAADVDPLTLLRRVSFDLTGLPPSPELVEHFLSNPSPAAYGGVVEELMATWQFGEFWAQHWLDELGYDPGVEEAWRFREYVIASLNRDKPFDQFVREQLAGDLKGGVESHLATGFFAVNPSREPGQQASLVAEMILGARDFPLGDLERDALVKIFGRPGRTEIFPLELDPERYPPQNLVEDDRVATERKRLRGLISSGERRLARARERKEPERVQRLRAQVARMSGELLDLEEAARDQIVSTGSRFVAVAGFPAGIGSGGRSDYVDGLVDGEHPLTARALVNRTWKKLFGGGLVAADDGGAAAGHVELLDYLAVQFVEDGWSVKSLVRQLVISRSYQLGEMEVAGSHWHAPRELDGGELRDTIISLAGWLEPAGAAPGRMLARHEFRAIPDIEDEHRYRSIYVRSPEVDEELVFEAAVAASRRSIGSDSTLGSVGRVHEMFVNVLGRQPIADESEWAVGVIDRAGLVDGGGVKIASLRPDQWRPRAVYLEGLLPSVRVDGGRDGGGVVRWAMLYHALMMSDEFRTVE